MQKNCYIEPRESIKVILNFKNKILWRDGPPRVWHSNAYNDYQLYFMRTYIFSVELETVPKKDFYYIYQGTEDYQDLCPSFSVNTFYVRYNNTWCILSVSNFNNHTNQII